MFRSLLPKEAGFFDHFERHIALTIEGCRELEAITSGKSEITAGYQRIKEIEHKADTVTHQCVEALHSTFITPMDRPHIQRLITRLDDIMDAVDAAASRMIVYEIREMRPEAAALAG